MGMLVTTGAQLTCSYGAAPTALSASGPKVSATAAAAVVNDFGTQNIASFGMCTAPTNPDVIAAQGSPAPCKPLLSRWTPGALRVTVNGAAALDSESKCLCDWAGVVSVAQPGQDRVTIA